MKITSSRLLSTSLLLLLGTTTSAHAQDEPAPVAPANAPSAPLAPSPPPAGEVTDQPGVDLAVRLGYAIPIGDVAQNSAFSDVLSGAVPLVLEAAFRATPNVSVGALFEYAIAQTKNCDPGSSCSASVIRAGIEGIYNLRLGTVFDPWVGLGAGYEWLRFSETGATAGSGNFHGFEFVTLQAGGDFRVAPQFALGPFVSFSVAEYSSASINGASEDIQNTAVHEWLQFGVRGTFSL
jgi:hypothetical protein